MVKAKYSIVTSGPSVEPIGRDDIAKLHLKLDSGTTEDGLLDIWIQTAREVIEDRTGRSFITQTRRIKLDYFPCGNSITLTNGPVQSVTSVKYYDDDDVQQTLDTSLYWVDTHGPIARIVIKDSWPSTKDRPSAVEIIYVCGYGDASTAVPSALKTACLLMLGHLYENRQENIVGASVSSIPEGIERIISTYVVTQDASQ